MDKDQIIKNLRFAVQYLNEIFLGGSDDKFNKEVRAKRNEIEDLMSEVIRSVEGPEPTLTPDQEKTLNELEDEAKEYVPDTKIGEKPMV